jgi:hypothetical protein
VRKRGWPLAAVVTAAVALAAAALFGPRAYRAPRAIGTVRVTPSPGRLSVRVGEAVQFTASAEGASRLAWSIWDTQMSAEPEWTYVPGPEDAGWQQIRLVAVAPDETRVERTWDVGVVAAVAPELVEVTPAPGAITLAGDGAKSFRVHARVPAARPADRLRFEWTMDGRVLRRDDREAGAATSELALQSAPPGQHRLTVRVMEDDRVASLAEWAVQVAARRPLEVAPTLPPLPPAPPVPPPVPVAPASPPPPPTEVAPAPPPTKLVGVPGSRRLTAEIGEPLAFSVRLEPPRAGATYRWSVDDEAVEHSTNTTFGYEPDASGAHRVAVAVVADGKPIATQSWMVTVRSRVTAAVPAPREEAPPPATVPPRREPEPPPAVVPPPVATPPPAREPEAPIAVAPPPPPAEPPAVVAPPPARGPEPTAVASVPPTSAPNGSASLVEGDVRSWLQEYALAWSRKDARALQRMGQVKTAAEVERLERYFQSISDLRVDVRVLGLRVDGDKASVEFERMDTVTDPSGRQQQLRLPPMRKQIERTPDGLRFTSGGEGRG